MKVLVISASFPPMRSGGADYALRLCQHLAGAGLQVHVLTSQIPNVATDPDIRVHPIMRAWSWREWPRLARLARRLRPDVVNLHFIGDIYHHHPMVTFVPFLLKKILPQVRIVTLMEHNYGLRPPSLTYFERISWRLFALVAGLHKLHYEFGTVLRDSDSVIVLSDAHRVSIEQRWPGVSAKTLLIPPPPIMVMSQDEGESTRARGREMAGVEPDDFLLAYYGYIYPGKGVDTLLRAFALLCEACERQFKLILIGGVNEVMKSADGSSYLDELLDLAAQLGITHSLIWTGYYDTESEQASLWLRGADLCVLPFDDGVYLNNSSFAAAAAHALPIVTTRAKVVEPAFQDGENLLFAEPKDPQSLCEAIQSAIDDPALRARLSQGAARMARRWFSWDSTVKQTLEAFGFKSGSRT